MKYNKLLLDIKKDYDLKNQLFPIPNNYPKEFKEAFDMYLEELILKDKSVKTIKSYYYDLKIFFNYILDNFKSIKNLSDIKVLHLTRFYSYIQRERENQFKSISRKKIVLNQFFSFLEQQGFLEDGKSPIPKEEVIKTKKKEHNKKPVFLELYEIEKLFSTINSVKNTFLRYRDITICAISLKTGLRVSELVSLNLSDIEYAKKHGILIVVGKGNKERRIAIRKEDFEEGYLSYLDKYLELRLKMQDKIKDNDVDALFISNKKSRLTDRQVERIVKKYKNLANIDKVITPHKFRHSFATHLVRSGAPLRVVQELLGHESVATTQIYTHLVDDDLKHTIEKYSPRI